jgi:type I restriction enzyme S subunit
MKQGWEIKSLMEIASVSTGKWDANHATENGDYRFYTCAYDYLFCNTKRFEGECLILPGNGVNVGEVFYYDGSFDAYQRTYVISDIKVLPKYLHYHMLLHWKALGTKQQYGSATNFIKIGNFKEYEVQYPPLPEQQRIVSILDEAFAAIDKAKANAEKNLKNAKELFESYLQGVFENGNWEIKTLNQISINLDSKRVPITKNKRKSGNVPYYGASGIVDYVEGYLFNEDLLCISEDGANLLARTYPIAFSISGKSWINNHAHILKFSSSITQRYVEIYFNSIKIDEYISGMAQPKLNQAKLNKIPVPFPPVNEQKLIVQKLDVLSAKIQMLEALYQKKMDDLEELKKSFLQKAFTGELKTEKAEAI